MAEAARMPRGGNLVSVTIEAKIRKDLGSGESVVANNLEQPRDAAKNSLDVAWKRVNLLRKRSIKALSRNGLARRRVY